MKTVLILGALSDMAQAVAQFYAASGIEIWLAGRKEEELKIVGKDLEIRYKANTKSFYFDAFDYASHPEFYNNLPGRPDLTVCAFGYLGDQDQGQKTWSEAEKIIKANYTGAVSALNIIANDYENVGSGIIVGISSVAGDRGRMSNYLYGSAKAGFTAYLSGLRNRLYKSGVHVMTVKPGFVKTKMTEHLELPGLLTASPEKVAKLVAMGVKKRKNTIYVIPAWKWVMLIIRSIPEFIFKKMKL